MSIDSLLFDVLLGSGFDLESTFAKFHLLWFFLFFFSLSTEAYREHAGCGESRSVCASVCVCVYWYVKAIACVRLCLCGGGADAPGAKTLDISLNVGSS